MLGAVVVSASLAQGETRGADPQVTPGSFADLSANVSAISGAQTSADVLTKRLARAAETMGVSAEARSQARKVFESAPTGPVFVMPANGGLAFLTGEVGGVLEGSLTAANPVFGGAVEPGVGEASYVWGVAVDGVLGVDVIVNDKSFPATMVPNGFYWVALDDAGTLEGLRLDVQLEDGTTISY